MVCICYQLGRFTWAWRTAPGNISLVDCLLRQLLNRVRPSENPSRFVCVSLSTIKLFYLANKIITKRSLYIGKRWTKRTTLKIVKKKFFSFFKTVFNHHLLLLSLFLYSFECLKIFSQIDFQEYVKWTQCFVGCRKYIPCLLRYI